MRAASLPENIPIRALPNERTLPGGSPLSPLETVSPTRHHQEEVMTATTPPRLYSEVARAEHADAPAMISDRI